MAIAAFAAAILPPQAASAASPFPALQGSWSGSGRIQFESGQTESLRCTASYVSTGGGNQLGLSIRCASASNRIEIRGQLTYSGGRVRGTWEERSFNASGTASGQASANSISLGLTGTIAGTMSVSVSRTRQSVAITTQGAALRGVRIGMSRR